MTIAKKLHLLTLAVILGLASLSLLGIYQSREVAKAASYSSVNTVPSLLALGDAGEAAFGIRVGIWKYAAATDPVSRTRLEKAMAEQHDRVLAAFDRYAREDISDDTDRKLLEADRQAFADYEKQRAVVLRIGAESRNEEALRAIEQLVVPPGDKLIAALAEHRKYKEQLGRQGVETAEGILQSSTYQAILVSLLVAAIVGATSLLISRGISVSLDDAIRVANAIAHGDLSSKVKMTGKDEVGQLLHAIGEMTASLVNIVGNVRQSVAAIESASSEIASGNLDLSARTEAQAGSIEETASAMEQLTATVKQNADNAHQADTLASSASSVASEGGKVVQEVVHTMDAINSSSLKIVDIISVIDGIAFQTNILALNAAVEAARAGEQGRGFAVVASEVRSLAQRSASAAREIKELIDDSVDKVQSGSRLVMQAGNTMEQVVTSVQRVSDIVRDISVASGEQSDGIAQVNQAIGMMDQTTQQNAALVEEAAAASQSLREQAKGLAQAVSVFRLERSAAAAKPAVAAPVQEQPAMLALTA
jgi:methyl-accepting chemotaxis protein